MNDFFQQSKKQQEINESLFGNIFSKKQNPQPQVAGPQITKIGNSVTIKFENGSIAQEVNTIAALPYLQELDWDNSRLSVLNLPGTKFNAKYLELDLNTQEILTFMGSWMSGPFIGHHFEGKFHGSTFQGDFIGKYTDYESEPNSFVDGTFLDITNSGILGIPNVITLHKLGNKRFSLIAIPEGHYLQFRSRNGITGYIKVLKRLNEVNSDFKFEILDGFKAQKTPQTFNIPWSEFRIDFQIKNEANRKYYIGRNSKNIAGFIQVPEGDFIKEMYISTAPATFVTPPSVASSEQQYEPGKKYSFDLSKIPYLNIKSIKNSDGNFINPNVELEFYSPAEFDKFKEVVSYINSGVLKQDMKNVLMAIKYGEVDGYGPVKYLSKVFSGNKGNFSADKPSKKGKRISEVGKGSMSNPKFKTPSVSSQSQYVRTGIPKSTGQVTENQFGTMPSMQRLNDFIRFFVNNIVFQDGEPNLYAQDLIVSRLKTILGTEAVQKPATSAKQNQGSEPGLTSSDFLPESIRNTVRSIINDSF